MNAQLHKEPLSRPLQLDTHTSNKTRARVNSRFETLANRERRRAYTGVRATVRRVLLSLYVTLLPLSRDNEAEATVRHRNDRSLRFPSEALAEVVSI